jgi:GntR family transcriptional repressor for pyruvate dehydrogenase complex
VGCAIISARPRQHLPPMRRTSSPTPATVTDAPPADPEILESLGLREVRSQRGFEAVCDQIRQQVFRGELRPGDRLPGERELAEQLAVSRSVVREAIRSLESRIELTCTAIRLACERATEAELDAIEADIEHHAELFRKGQGSRNARSLHRFYHLLAEATHNDLMVMLVDAVSEVMRMILLRIDPQPHPDMVAVRRKVLRYLRARDAVGASEAMRVHLHHLTAYLEAESKA